MKILDFFKNLIYRNKKPMLNEANIDMDRTARIIKIEAIEEIINNPETFEQFLNYEKNREKFGEDIEKTDYILAIKEYSDFMNENEVDMSKESQKRIKKILKHIPNNDKEKKQSIEYEKISRKSLYMETKEILSSEDRFKEFVNSKEQFNGIKKEILEDYISSEFGKLNSRIEYSTEEKQRYYFIASKNATRKKSTRTKENYKNPASYKINPDFEKSIMENISPDAKGTKLAFEIYNELNKKVKYNPAFFALEQDLNIEFAKQIYYGDIEEINNSNNKVVCSTWSELYSYFLEKNGIESYIMEKGKHRNVIAYDGTNRIEADATNATNSLDDSSELTDLVRCKLGVRPAGFKVISYEKAESDISKDMEIVKTDFTDTDYTKFEGTDDFKELMELIDDDRKLSVDALGLEDKEDSLENIITKITYINDLLKGNKLDNFDSLGYIRHLYQNILNANEKKRTSLSNALYENLYLDCNILTVISIYKGRFGENDEKIDDKYIYLMYNQNKHQFGSISKEKIIDDIKNKRIERIKNDNDYRTIEGIPEIDMEQEINSEKQGIKQEQQKKIKKIEDEGRG